MTQAHHTLVAGDSGGGKTTYLREAHATYPGLSVWVDHSGTGGISGHDLDDAATVRSLSDAANSDALRLRWVCDDPVECARGAREVCHRYHNRTGYPTQVIIDEAQDRALPDGDVEPSNPIKQMLHQDRDQKLKVQLSTQDPQDLEYTPLKQCKHWVWVGPWSTFHEGFLRYFSMPREELPTEPYRYVVFDKRMNPTHRGETNEEYA